MSLIFGPRCGTRPGGAFALMLAGFCALLGPCRAHATDAASDQAEPAIVVSAGVFALVEAFDYPYNFGIEYLSRPQTRWLLTAALGLSFGRDGMAFLRAGIERDFHLGAHWFVTPSMAGGYFNNGDLVGVRDHLEFHTGIAVSRRSRSGMRWGVAGYHVSNAGLERPNNGTEAVVFFLRVPLRGNSARD